MRELATINWISVARPEMASNSASILGPSVLPRMRTRSADFVPKSLRTESTPASTNFATTPGPMPTISMVFAKCTSCALSTSVLTTDPAPTICTRCVAFASHFHWDPSEPLGILGAAAAVTTRSTAGITSPLRRITIRAPGASLLSTTNFALCAVTNSMRALPTTTGSICRRGIR